MKSLRDYINLVSETNLLSEKVTLNPDGTVPQTQTVNGVTMNAPANAVQTGSGGVLKTGSGAAVTSGTPAPAPDAAAAAKAKLTPSQLKWLGGADATDSAIMARMPKPLPGEAVPGAAPAQAAQPAPNTTSAATGVGIPGEEAAADADFLKRQKETNAQTAADTQATAQAATIASGQPDDVAGVDAAVAAQANQAASAPLQLPPGAAPEAGMTVAGGAAKPKVMAKPDPAVMKLQQDLIAKGAKIKADGVMGPATQAAQKQFSGAPQAAQPAAKPAPYNAAKDSQAANVAPAQAAQPAGSFAADTAARKQAANPMGIAKEGRLARNDHAFIDELNAMRSIAGLPTKNKW